MQKKLLLMVIMVVVMACTLAACQTHTHSFSEWTVETAATCTEDGVEVRKCECGETETRVINKKGHRFGEWTVETAATCTEAGTKKRVCSACNEVETETIPAKGHTEVVEETAATCVQDGKKVTKCSVCGEVLKTEVIEATGHTEGEFEVLTAATCTQKGVRVKKCTVCGEELAREEIPIVAHSYVGTVLNKKTCSSKAKVKYSCSVCNDSYTQETTDIKGISIALISQSSIGFGGNVKYDNGYQVSVAGGGYGAYTYHVVIENLSNNSIVGDLDLEPSAVFSLTYRGAEADIKNYLAKITISDEAGNATYAEINLANPDVVLKTEVLAGECLSIEAVDTKEYINQHGAGRYKCSECSKVVYRDMAGKQLILADLIISADGTTLEGLNNKETAELVVIPSTVTTYKEHSDFGKKFAYADNLKYVIDESSIKDSISFQGCQLDRIVVSKNKEYSLSQMDNLDTVILENGVEGMLTSVYIDNVSSLYINDSHIKNMVIPKSVMEIYYPYFAGTTVVDNLFYGGTAEDYAKIVFSGTGENNLDKSTLYYFSETEPTAAGNYWHYVDGLPVIWTK